MKIEVKVPSPGESISEVQLAAWLVEDGEQVEKDQEIAELDSDKASLTISAEDSGKIELKVEEGENVEVEAVIAVIDTDVKGKKKETEVGSRKTEDGRRKTEDGSRKTEDGSRKTEDGSRKTEDGGRKSEDGSKKEEEDAEDKKSSGKEQADDKEEKETGKKGDQGEKASLGFHVSPLARKLMKEENISEKDLYEFFKTLRVSRADVEFYQKNKDKLSDHKTSQAQLSGWGGTRDTEPKKMSTLRLKLGKRLVAVNNETAMLTTFNEVNMSPIMEIRKKYKESFKEKHGIGLGFMSFFTKAITEALNLFPQVNAQIDGNEIIYHKYADIGIAVSAPKGLMVPVIRNAETRSLADIEKKIKELAEKARNGKLSLDEMQGGTFTITNGGVFGSMLSTPILNPPQSAILGMHNIVERPIAVNGKVEIHPIMYVALSYDHRVVDGKESVSFLYKVKEMLENPVKLMFGGNEPEKHLLGL
ncbi:MAG: 2-oxoglutarate dehydrogenase complex dihydrolipoyllysine-residue succinyltransferase [Bacteroidota bacterium]|nr:2-oxoglutarate dehydrogenase complex dihydrolipoyllysine-residue succinyltransferase [Bacteroidota bacterium]